MTPKYSGQRDLGKKMQTQIRLLFQEQSDQGSSLFALPFTSFLAHLCRRLIGELIGYSWSGVRPSSVVVHNAQRSSSPKPLARSKPNFMWSPPWVGGTKVLFAASGSHDQDGPPRPYMVKNPSKIFFSRTGRPIFTKLGM